MAFWGPGIGDRVSDGRDYPEDWDSDDWGPSARDSEPEPGSDGLENLIGVHDTYQLELGEILFKLIKDYSHLADFTIVCSGGEDLTGADTKNHLQTYKLLLIARSKYFEALFRQEPNITTAQLDFDSNLVSVILDNLIKTPKFENFDIYHLMRLLEITDFLQMESFTRFIVLDFNAKLSVKNIVDVISYSQNIHVPELNLGCYKFVKENISNLKNVLVTIPVQWLKGLSPSPTCNGKDEYGRLLCLNDTETFVVAALNELNPEEEWNVSDETKLRMQASFNRSFGKLNLSREKQDFLCFKYELTLSQSVNPNRLEPPEVDICGRADLKLNQVPAFWGSAANANGQEALTLRHSVKGNFRKIGVKTRQWDGRKIVQGLRLEFDTGEVKCIGMKDRDMVNVTQLIVPEGQHIKDVILKCGWYIDSIGFITNEGVRLGPIGGDGGGDYAVGQDTINMKKYLTFYLYEMSYVVVESDHSGRNARPSGHATPCIARLQFSFILVPK